MYTVNKNWVGMQTVYLKKSNMKFFLLLKKNFFLNIIYGKLIVRLLKII